MRPALLITLALGLAIAACSRTSDCDPAASELTFRATGGAVLLHVEVVRSREERARGLMGRDELPADHGMVFVFDAPTTTAFWMKYTSIPLSIAFWDGEDRIVGILDMPPCTSDTCPTYAPDAPYVAAVETNLGYFEQRGIAVGDRVRFVEKACID